MSRSMKDRKKEEEENENGYRASSKVYIFEKGWEKKKQRRKCNINYHMVILSSYVICYVDRKCHPMFDLMTINIWLD